MTITNTWGVLSFRGVGDVEGDALLAWGVGEGLGR
jgi:hypothetical protein